MLVYHDFPVNEGRLCPKGVTAYLQTHHPDRLLYPLIKRNGKFERASWDEALNLVVSKFKELQSKHGKDSIAVYSGSSLTTEKTYLMGKFARVGLQTKYVDYNGRLCMVSAAAGSNKAFGIDRAANPWSDIPFAEVLLIAGANCAETFPVLNKFLWQQRDNGGVWIIVDPRETSTARQGDLHLQLKPGTDVAFTNAMLHVIIEENLIDEKFIESRTNGWEDTKALVKKYTPQISSEITGVPVEKIVKAARIYGRAKTAMLMHARGIEHHSRGVNNVLSYINLVLATCAYQHRATLDSCGDNRSGVGVSFQGSNPARCSFVLLFFDNTFNLVLVASRFAPLHKRGVFTQKMKSKIIGFEKDEEGDWRAALECAHYQHVRHNPPLTKREWVLSKEGRRSRLGCDLECKKCDEGKPKDFSN